ncbi:MAG: hypothetical protein ACLP5V_11510 [Candidatus Bathyarchaeia archaeon]
MLSISDRKRSKLTDNENRILALFAEGRLSVPTRYAIAKSLYLRSSSVQYVVNKLTERNLLQVGLSKKWRTGRIRRELSLTFVGTMFCLAMLQAKKSHKGHQEPVRRFVKSQGASLAYAPFTEFDEIDENKAGNKAADVFTSSASLFLTYIGRLAPCDWNFFTFKGWDFKSMRPDAITETKAKERQEQAWREGFAELLLDSYLRHQVPPVWRNNQKLNMFYDEMLLRQEEEKHKELERITSDRKYLLQYRKVRAIQDTT